MKETILLLAADEKLTDTVKSMLMSYTVIECGNERHALDLCRAHDISLVLLEDSVEGVDPLKMLTTFRAIRPTITVILLSSRIDNNVLNKAIDAGFGYVVEIPVKKERLLKAVEVIVNRVKLLGENTRLKMLLPLYSLGEKFLSSTTEKEVLNSLIESVAEVTEAKHISILLYDVDRSYLRISASRGMDVQLADSVQLHSGDHIAGWVFKHGKPVILNKEDQAESIFAPFLKRPEIVSAISCPISIRGVIIGVLNISQTETEDRFSESDKEIISVVCGQAALALENVRGLQQLEETTRTRTLLEQYVSPEVAELLLKQQEDPVNVGGIEEITILFADIRNFTKLVQHLDLNDLRTFLNEFFNNFSEVIFQKQGTIDKFMGDAVLAFFGAPIHNQYSSCAAVEAAIAMKKSFKSLCHQWIQKDPVFKELDLGIGVTRGKVFLGNVGSEKRFDYTVIGNEVNIAQRLAAESTQCRVYMTDVVKENVKQAFIIKPWGEVSLRGIQEKLPVFCLSEGES